MSHRQIPVTALPSIEEDVEDKHHKSKSTRKIGVNLSLGKAILLRHQVKHQLLRDAVSAFESIPKSEVKSMNSLRSCSRPRQDLRE